MSLDAHIIATVGTLELDVELVIEPGQVVALLGPNGAGKTTVLRCLAGLLPVDNGYVRLGSETWDDAARDVFVRPERRPVGVVFQDYLLFPNLTALDNVAFGLPEASRHARRRLPLPRGWNGSA
jgi:molybdate transport system ATP-binding protein